MSARALELALRAGRDVADVAFDALWPDAIRAVSARFWTPLAVVRRGVQWLDEEGVGDVLDIGSGGGKFCVAAALMDQGTRRYVGLKHRPELVAAARELAAVLGVGDRVHFELGTLTGAPLPSSAAYYLFNPFGENIAPDVERFDDSVELTDARYERDVAATEALFVAAPVGSHVLVYHGFGGRMPATYEPICIDYDLPNVLRLWVKRPTSGWRTNIDPRRSW